MAQQRKSGSASGNPAKRSVRKPSPTKLATLSEEDKLEYANRYRLAQDAHVTAMALAKHWDDFGEELTERYNLPKKFEVNFQTGAITAPQEEQA